MSKYDRLWKHVGADGRQTFKLSFEEIEGAGGCPIDHSFLTFKKELAAYGYKVGKISLKERTVIFSKLE